MTKFSVPSLENQSLREEVQKKLRSNNITPGLYGSFEELIIKACLILGTSEPKLKRPASILFAGDHGYLKGNPSLGDALSSSEKVYQVLNGHSPASLLHKQNRMHLKVIDVGVDHQFESNLMYWLNHGKKLINKKIKESTRDFMDFPAMTTSDCTKAIEIGAKAVQKEFKNSCNLIGISSVAKGSELSAAIIAIALLQLKPNALGLDKEKVQFIKKALNQHPKTRDPLTLLSLFGGFELAAMCGAYSEAAAKGMIILVDGLESTLALYIAQLWNPGIVDYFLIAAKTQNTLQEILNKELGIEKLIESASGAGEGFSIGMAYPQIKNACGLIHDLPEA